MADISKIKPNGASGTEYEIKDTTARTGLLSKASVDDITVETKTDDAPYLYRASESIGDRACVEKLVGGSVAWNQLLVSKHKQHSYNPSYGSAIYDITVASSLGIPIIQGHKYLLSAKMTRMLSVNNFLRLVLWSQNASAQAMLVWNNGDANGYKQTIYLPYSNQTSFEKIAFNNYSGKQGFSAGDTMEYDDFILIDLTVLFGTSIADYAYTLEQSQQGSGIAWLKSYGFFTKDYYPYNTGQLVSVKTSEKKVVGFNLFGGHYNQCSISSVTGIPFTSTNRCCTDMFKVLPNTRYCFNTNNGSIEKILFEVYWYDGGQNFISYQSVLAKQTIINSPLDAYYCRVLFKLTTNADTVPSDWENVFCINISDTSKNGQYLPYTSTTYPLGNDELRGIPKLVNNQLVYDGDIKTSDGVISRKYGIVDLGSLTWKYSDADLRFYTTEISNMETEPNGSYVHGICAIYESINYNGNRGTVTNMKMGAITVSGTVYFNLTNTTYTDAATFKTAMDGVYLVYELATPTTENSTPYQNLQVVDTNGTEEFIDTRSVPIPVGHNTVYDKYPDFFHGTVIDAYKEKVDSLPLEVASKLDKLDKADMFDDTFSERGIDGEYQITRISNEIHIAVVIDDASIATQTGSVDLIADLPDDFKCNPSYGAVLALRHSSGTGKIEFKINPGTTTQSFYMYVEEVNTTSGVWFPIYDVPGKAL